MAALRQAALAACCIVAVSAAAAPDLEQRLAGAKGNGMAFPGIVNADDRASLVAWLLANSGAQ